MPTFPSSDQAEAALLKLVEYHDGNLAQVLVLAPFFQAGGLNLATPALLKKIWRPLWVKHIRNPNSWDPNEQPLKQLAQLEQLGVLEGLLRLPPSESALSSDPALAVLLEALPDLETYHAQRQPESATGSAIWTHHLTVALNAVAPATDANTARQHMTVLRRLVWVGAWEAASQAVHLLRLDLNDLALQDHSPITRCPHPEAWDWFLDHGGQPDACDAQGRPLWLLAATRHAQPVPKVKQYPGKAELLRQTPPSEGARAWARKDRPDQAETLRLTDYFNDLATLVKVFEKDPYTWHDSSRHRYSAQNPYRHEAHVAEKRGKEAWARLTSEPDWATLVHPNGLPALFVAVTHAPHVLLNLPAQAQGQWHLQAQVPQPGHAPGPVPEGGGLWEALVRLPTQIHLKPVLEKLAHHCPLPEQADRPWLWPVNDHFNAQVWRNGTAAAMDLRKEANHPKTWIAVLKQRSELFVGTPEQQGAFAQAVWQAPVDALFNSRARQPQALLEQWAQVHDPNWSPAWRGLMLALRFLHVERLEPMAEELQQWNQYPWTMPDHDPSTARGVVSLWAHLSQSAIGQWMVPAQKARDRLSDLKARPAAPPSPRRRPRS